MNRNIFLALALVAIVATPAFASVQNIKVSGDIDSTYVGRRNFDLGTNTVIPAQTNPNKDEQSVFITQTRLRVDADLSDNVAATVALINERDWNAEDENADDTDIDLNLAYVTLREMLYSPLSVTIGRQQLNYGNALVIGAGGPNNTSTGRLATVAADLTKRAALDGVKAVLNYNPLTIDLFAAKVDANTVTSAGTADDDVDLYGINANYQLGDEMNTIVEGYFFTKHDDSTDNAGGSKADVIYVPGLRVSTNPISGLNLQAEVAWQAGRKAVTGNATPDNVDREAMAGQVIANYAVPVAQQYNPLLSAVYTYVSGDKNDSNNNNVFSQASDEVYTAWDPMFEDQGFGTIYNTLFDLTNMHIVTLSGQITPVEDITTKLTWSSLWLDKEVQSRTFNMRQPDQTATINPTVTGEDEIGQELDIDVTYDYTEDVQFGLNAGYFLPGDFFASNNDKTASQVLANVAVAF